MRSILQQEKAAREEKAEQAFCTEQLKNGELEPELVKSYNQRAADSRRREAEALSLAGASRAKLGPFNRNALLTLKRNVLFNTLLETREARDKLLARLRGRKFEYVAINKNFGGTINRMLSLPV